MDLSKVYPNSVLSISVPRSSSIKKKFRNGYPLTTNSTILAMCGKKKTLKIYTQTTWMVIPKNTNCVWASETKEKEEVNRGFIINSVITAGN